MNFSDRNEETKNEEQFERYKRLTQQEDTSILQEVIFNDSDENASNDLEQINEEQDYDFDMNTHNENSLDFLINKNDKRKRVLEMQPGTQVLIPVQPVDETYQ